MAKGRKPLDIDVAKLQSLITEIESGDSPPKSRTELWKLVSASFVPSASPQTLMMRAEKENLSIQTPKGVRGVIYTRGEAKATPPKRKKKFLKEFQPEVTERFERLGEKTVTKLLSGNLKTAIKAFCWDCMGESKKEVALCASYSCPLWPHRPWTLEKEKKIFSLPVVSETNNSLSEKLESGEGGALPPSSCQD